jgi:hypothetical protein
VVAEEANGRPYSGGKKHKKLLVTPRWRRLPPKKRQEQRLRRSRFAPTHRLWSYSNSGPARNPGFLIPPRRRMLLPQESTACPVGGRRHHPRLGGGETQAWRPI